MIPIFVLLHHKNNGQAKSRFREFVEMSEIKKAPLFTAEPCDTIYKDRLIILRF